MDRSPSALLALTAVAVATLASRPAHAASLQKVAQSDWGSAGFPSYVNMYIYVPDTLAGKPPIVVIPHHCQGTAQSSYSESASLRTVADRNGFILIMPEATGQNCWDAGSPRSLKHNGSGDTGAIVQMVKYALAKYKGDPARVYSVGGSSGGIMTEALLGVYPDVFMAGVSLMGVPCGCWAQNYNDVTGTGGTAQWSGPCAGGNVVKTGAQWGDLVKSYFPGYTSHRPRLQHWHGTADTTLNYKNMAEDVKEWTNLLGLSEMPNGTDTPKSGTTRQFWKNACGYTVYETFALAGVGHAVPFDGAAIAAYFGLDKTDGQDPETAACPGALPGGVSGAGGAAGGSPGGSTGGHAGGATGTVGGKGGGTAGTGGNAGTGGVATGGNGEGGAMTGGRPGPTGGTGHDTGGAPSTATGGSEAATGGRQGTGGGPSATGGNGPSTPKGDSSGGCTLGESGGASLASVATGVALLAALRRRRQARAA